MLLNPDAGAEGVVRDPDAVPRTAGSASGDPRLRRWRANVGADVERDFAPGPAGGRPIDVLVLLSWNVWIGRGRLVELIGRLRAGGFVELGAPAGAPVIALVQEAFRADDSIPAVSRGGAGPARARDFRPQEDIVEVARALGLNVRYAPSMRNGAHRSDRGNAILSTLPLEETGAFELPFVIQRRVAVGAIARVPQAVGVPRRLRVYSAHLDPWGSIGKDWLGVAGRAVQARALLESIERHTSASLPVALGADLNTARGRREAAYRLLREVGFTVGVPHRDPTWDHTYHLVPRLPIDYLLFRVPAEPALSATVHRLNEHPRDAGSYVFGSDHHPLIARVELNPPPAGLA